MHTALSHMDDLSIHMHRYSPAAYDDRDTPLCLAEEGRGVRGCVCEDDGDGTDRGCEADGWSGRGTAFWIEVNYHTTVSEGGREGFRSGCVGE